MSSHTAYSILLAFYDAEREYMGAPTESRDFRILEPTLAKDAILIQTPALPYAGTYIGIEGLEDWAQRMSDTWSKVDVQNLQVFEREGSDHVISLSEVYFKSRKTGEELNFPMCQLITVDLEAGKVKSIRPFYWDVHAVNTVTQHVP
ncbi:hypothetical protein FSARC_14430 [Fusarium sarcochroum]|uniref:SnoaL-like domain-containing protein n=1 Tax=Fusarium sarcochroum TaxID=1208366 RepID=A0A8H4STT4_9HYPO|nr:hypothetical protein FSARC_14430 [Fusarium sarcochroum]